MHVACAIERLWLEEGKALCRVRNESHRRVQVTSCSRHAAVLAWQILTLPCSSTLQRARFEKCSRRQPDITPTVLRGLGFTRVSAVLCLSEALIQALFQQSVLAKACFVETALVQLTSCMPHRFDIIYMKQLLHAKPNVIASEDFV